MTVRSAAAPQDNGTLDDLATLATGLGVGVAGNQQMLRGGEAIDRMPSGIAVYAPEAAPGDFGAAGLVDFACRPIREALVALTGTGTTDKAGRQSQSASHFTVHFEPRRARASTPVALAREAVC